MARLEEFARDRQNAFMKAFLISPPFEMYGVDDERTTASINLIAELLFKSLRRGGDTFHSAVVWANPGDEPGGIWNEDIAEPHFFNLHNGDALRAWLRLSVDPNTSGGGNVRSVATCRAVTFGYDGQALICLRHEDDAPQSPDPTLAVVEERSDLLVESDWLDGWARTAGQ